MKLRNIIIALSAAVAFAACSKDDNGIDPNKPDPNKPYENAKAELTVKVITKGTKTKADSNELSGEANINNLFAFVFNPTNGKKVGHLSATPKVTHTYIMEGIPSEMVGAVQLVVIANAPTSISEVSTYAELQGLLAELSTQEQGNLTMSTPLISPALEEGLNDLGQLVLTRIAARVQVRGVKTNFSLPLLVGRRVQIDQIYFENVKTKSSYFSVTDWGKVNVAGNFGSTTVSNPQRLTPMDDLGYVAYVMENLGEEEGKTTLVVEATLEANGRTMPESHRTFRAVVNPNGKTNGADHNYVKRNYVYDLDITFGDSSFDPEHLIGYLDVEVSVASWGEVKQTPQF